MFWIRCENIRLGIDPWCLCILLFVYRFHHLYQTFSFGDDASEVSEDNEPDIGAEYRISRVISRTGV